MIIIKSTVHIGFINPLYKKNPIYQLPWNSALTLYTFSKELRNQKGHSWFLIQKYYSLKFLL